MKFRLLKGGEEIPFEFDEGLPVFLECEDCGESWEVKPEWMEDRESDSDAPCIHPDPGEDFFLGWDDGSYSHGGCGGGRISVRIEDGENGFEYGVDDPEAQP